MSSQRPLLTGAASLAVIASVGFFGVPLAVATPVHTAGQVQATPITGSDYTVDASTQLGQNSRDVTLDQVKGRAYVVVDRGTKTNGALQWLDTDTGKPGGIVELPAAEPSKVVISRDGANAYVMHYRNGTMSVVDTASGTVTGTISGLPLNPVGLVQDTDTGLLYVAAGKSLTEINPLTSSVSPAIDISAAKFASINGVAYDSANHMVWVSTTQNDAGVVTGYSTLARQWMNSLQIPVTTFAFPKGGAGGFIGSITVDKDLGRLYVLVDPDFEVDWLNSRVVAIDARTGKFLGEPMEVGDTAVQIAVNPATHEVYTTNSYENTVSVISPATWNADSTFDFSVVGGQKGPSLKFADVRGVAVSGDGSSVYITHPSSNLLSTITRSGTVPTVTALPVTPGQESTEPSIPAREAWAGPAAAAPAVAPADSVKVTTPSFTWGLSNYMEAWTAEPLGSTEKVGSAFTFGSGEVPGTGWVDPRTHAASISWADGFRIRHYVKLAPDVISTFGNPVLTVDAEGKGTLTMDVAWQVSKDGHSDGFRRVTVATFSHATVDVTKPHLSGARAAEDTAQSTVTITATPDFKGRAYTADGVASPDSFPADFINYFDPQMRAWWYTSGASMDADKVPLPFTATFRAAVAEDPQPTGTPTPTASPSAGESTGPGASESPTATPSQNPSATQLGSPTFTSGPVSTVAPSAAATSPTNLGVPTASATPVDSLPNTGASLAMPLALAGAAVAAGAGITVAASRRRARH